MKIGWTPKSLRAFKRLIRKNPNLSDRRCRVHLQRLRTLRGFVYMGERWVGKLLFFLC